MTFRALDLCPRASQGIVGCLCLYSEQWSYAIGGLHCRHVGGQNKRTFAHIVCIKIVVNSPRRKILLFLSTNMVAMTSHANHQLVGAW